MPSLKVDNSILATVWRGHTNNGPFDLKELQKSNFKLGSARTYNRVNFALPTVVGLRDGIPWGQDQLDGAMRTRQLHPYPTAKTPFLSNNIEDIAPRTYATNPIGGTGGELTNLASLGGTPLAIALDDQTALSQRVHTEFMRSDPRNPLSAEFAWRAYIQQGEHPEKGPMADAQREQMGADEDSAAVIKSRISKGYAQTQRLNQEGHQKAMDILSRNKEPTSQDVLDLKDLFKANFLPTKKNNLEFINDMSNYFRDHIKVSAHRDHTSADQAGNQQPLPAKNETGDVFGILGTTPFMSRVQPQSDTDYFRSFTNKPVAGGYKATHATPIKRRDIISLGSLFTQPADTFQMSNPSFTHTRPYDATALSNSKRQRLGFPSVDGGLTGVDKNLLKPFNMGSPVSSRTRSKRGRE